MTYFVDRWRNCLDFTFVDVRMPRRVNWGGENSMADAEGDDSVVVRLLSVGLNLAADSVVKG